MILEHQLAIFGGQKSTNYACGISGLYTVQILTLLQENLQSFDSSGEMMPFKAMHHFSCDAGITIESFAIENLRFTTARVEMKAL